MVRRSRGAEGRVRERVRGGTWCGGGSAGRNRGAFDVGNIERYANRLRDQVGDSPRPRAPLRDPRGVVSRTRSRGSDAEGSEDFVAEVRERLDLI